MIYIFGFVFFTAIANIILHFIGNKIPDMLLIFLSTTFAIIFFNLINYKTIFFVYKKLLNKKLEYFLLVFTLFGIWVGAFLIPIYFLPSIYLLTFMAVGGAIGATVLFYEQKKLINLFRAIFLFINIIVFYVFCTKYYFGYRYIILILATGLTGISGYCYMRISATFNKYEFTSSQILAVRFWLLWLLSLGCVIYYNQFKYISLTIILQTIIISILYMIIPIYCSQKSIERIGAEKTILGMGFTPFVTFLLEKVFLKNSFDFTGYFAITLAIILTGFYLYGNYKREFGIRLSSRIRN